MILSALSRRRLLLRAIFVAVLVALLYAGLREQPVPQFFHGCMDRTHGEDKLHHVLGFAVLAASMRMAFPRGRMSWQLLALAVLGAAIELGQNLLPARTGSAWDMLAGVLGAVLGLALTQLPVLRRFAAAGE
jgi:VanZ family protein